MAEANTRAPQEQEDWTVDWAFGWTDWTVGRAIGWTAA